MPARRDGGGGGRSCRDRLGGSGIHVRANNDHDDGQDFPKDDGFKEKDPFDDNAETDGDRP